VINILANPYKSIVITDENEKAVIISEGDKIEFTIESSGEVIKDVVVTKFQGKEEKLKIQVFSAEMNCELIYPIVIMAEGSLKLVEYTKNDDFEDDEE
jgi:type II secretory pathway component PulC